MHDGHLLEPLWLDKDRSSINLPADVLGAGGLDCYTEVRRSRGLRSQPIPSNIRQVKSKRSLTGALGALAETLSAKAR
jgi:hypothetical protein